MRNSIIGMLIPIIVSFIVATRFCNQMEIGDECFEIFITRDDFPPMSTVGVHMAGIAHLQPPYLVERLDPGIHTLLFTSYGEGRLITEQGEQPITAGTMTVIPAHTAARFEIVSDRWDMCWFLLLPAMHWNQWMPEISEVRPTAQALTVFHLCHVIDQERHLEHRYQKTSFHKLASYIELNLKAHQPGQQDRLTAAFAQVEQSLHKPWTVGQVAGLCFYSEPHFYRLCQNRFGKSPKQIIRQLRIDRARQLLEHTDWPLAELAGRLGFSDQFNFSNRFKRETGQSPAQYRQQFAADV